MASTEAAGEAVDVDRALVRALLAEQHPDLAALPLGELTGGWDNVVVRLGDDLAVRLPRGEVPAALLANEQRWLPTLAVGLPVAVPVPVRTGAPGCGYPWPWSVVPWVGGRSAASDPPADLGAAAEVLGRFVAALHRPAPADAPTNPYRGVPLAERAAQVEERLSLLDDVDEVARRWDALVATPAWDGPPVWLHGDLHPANIVIEQGRVVAVVDFGDVCAGDPAVDLAVAWMLLDAGSRPVFRRAAGTGGSTGDPAVGEATWDRARAWAVYFGVALLTGRDDPPLHRVGRRTLREVLGDDPTV